MDSGDGSPPWEDCIIWGSQKDARYVSLMEYYKEISVLAAESIEEYH